MLKLSIDLTQRCCCSCCFQERKKTSNRRRADPVVSMSSIFESVLNEMRELPDVSSHFLFRALVGALPSSTEAA